MAIIEVAEIIHTVANAMAASVDIEPEHSADYTYLLTQMNTSSPADGVTVGKLGSDAQGSGETLGQTSEVLRHEHLIYHYPMHDYRKLVKDGYLKYSQNPKQGNSFDTKAIAYSVFDLTHLPAVSEALLQFAEEFKKERTPRLGRRVASFNKVKKAFGDAMKPFILTIQ